LIILVLTTFLGRRKILLVLVDGGKRENKLDVYNTFERMEVNRDSGGA
jgi:hypothetical protein